MNARIRIGQTFAAGIALSALLLPSRVTAEGPTTPPFDACKAVDARTAAGLTGAAIVNNAANYHQNETTPRQSSLCVYNAVNHAQLSVLLLRFGKSASDRESLSTFRTSYEKAAGSQYGKPLTSTDGDATVVTFQGVHGQVLDVAAFTETAVARITLTFGKVSPGALNALALSLVRTTYGATPPAPPTPSPDMAPCGRRASRAQFRG
jgi:hypothetical protein